MGLDGAENEDEPNYCLGEQAGLEQWHTERALVSGFILYGECRVDSFLLHKAVLADTMVKIVTRSWHDVC